MTSSKCLLGCTNVRYGARIVSIVDFWICVLLLIKCFTLLNPYYYEFYHYKSSTEQSSYDLNTFSHLFLISILLNANYHLKQSTYDHKIHKIHQWLVINTILLTFYIMGITYVAIMNYYPGIVYFGIPVSIILLCQIYVVKSFYDDELLKSSLPAPESTVTCPNGGPAVNQNSSQDSVNLTLTGPSIPNLVYQVQRPSLQQQHEAERPHSINGVALPVPVPIPMTAPLYPPLHQDQFVHDSAEPHFQTSMMQLQAGPSSELQQPQEYYNPPAYSPTYDQRAEIHCVRNI